MPELPDITVYIEALGRVALGHRLERVRVASPFLVRTFDPPLTAIEGTRVVSVERLGKRIVLGFEDDLFVVLHLMIAGRLRWRKPGATLARRVGLMALDFAAGSLILTEASKKKRASLHVVSGREALAAHDPGGLDVLTCDLGAFGDVVRRENHTLKRTLTDPRVLDGIGNAYSDEILHRARLSPVRWTDRLTDEEIARLFVAARATLEEWTSRLRAEVGDGFPDKVTAFREGMAVHGRYGQPCPACDAPVQRIVRADNEVNYCPTCQTGGKLLADRSLSRLLRGDWPRTVEELEQLKRARRGGGPAGP